MRSREGACDGRRPGPVPRESASWSPIWVLPSQHRIWIMGVANSTAPSLFSVSFSRFFWGFYCTSWPSVFLAGMLLMGIWLYPIDPLLFIFRLPTGFTFFLWGRRRYRLSFGQLGSVFQVWPTNILKSYISSNPSFVRLIKMRMTKEMFYSNSSDLCNVSYYHIIVSKSSIRTVGFFD